MKNSLKKILAMTLVLLLTLGCVATYADTAALTDYDDDEASNIFEDVIHENSGVLCFGGSDYYGEDNICYLKLKAERSGVLKFDMYASDQYGNYSSVAADGEVTLLNSSKKALSDDCDYEYEPQYFGVKKGSTYYLETECDDDYYVVEYSISAAKGVASSSKSKAKALSKGASATRALFLASTATSTDWYKFKVKKQSATTFTVDASEMGDSGYLTITAYYGSKKVGSSAKIDLEDGEKSGSYSITYSTVMGKAMAGTYYVKVTKSKYASGAYKIRYK